MSLPQIILKSSSQNLIFQLNYQNLHQLLSGVFSVPILRRELQLFLILDKWIKNQKNNVTSEEVQALFAHVHFERLSLQSLWSTVKATGYFSDGQLSIFSTSIAKMYPNYISIAQEHPIHPQSQSSLKRKAEEDIQSVNSSKIANH